MTIPQNLVKQPRSDDLARVNRHHGASAVLVSEEVVATLGTNRGKPPPREDGYKFESGNTRNSAHAATVMRWMPTNSSA